MVASLDQALYYHKLAAAQGHAKSQFKMGDLLFKHGINDKEAFGYFNLLSEGFDRSLRTKAQYYLAQCFEKGKKGVAQAAPKALNYYQLAAEAGSCLAQDRLGDAHLKGELGLRKSRDKAKYYYELAAQQGYSPALKKSGELEKEDHKDYRQPIFPPKPPFHLTKDVNDISFPSTGGLATGKFEKTRDYPREFRYQQILQNQWFEDLTQTFEETLALTEQGDAKAQFNLGVFYLFGKNVSQSYQEALKYFKLSSDQGYPKALHALGVCYEYGTGIKKSAETAYHYYQLGAIRD